jgi:hypothetical protein
MENTMTTFDALYEALVALNYRIAMDDAHAVNSDAVDRARAALAVLVPLAVKHISERDAWQDWPVAGSV